MPTRTERIIEAIAWGGPLLWAIAWALFRGEHAHGGYVWWGQVHIGGLLLLVPTALVARLLLWSIRGTRHLPSAAVHVASQVALVTVVVVANWIAFQAGMARHHPPEGLGEFLWSDP